MASPRNMEKKIFSQDFQDSGHPVTKHTASKTTWHLSVWQQATSLAHAMHDHQKRKAFCTNTQKNCWTRGSLVKLPLLPGNSLLRKPRYVSHHSKTQWQQQYSDHDLKYVSYLKLESIRLWLCICKYNGLAHPADDFMLVQDNWTYSVSIKTSPPPPNFFWNFCTKIGGYELPTNVQNLLLKVLRGTTYCILTHPE